MAKSETAPDGSRNKPSTGCCRKTTFAEFGAPNAPTWCEECGLDPTHHVTLHANRMRLHTRWNWLILLSNDAAEDEERPASE